ncbi:cellulase family glycosylhydrolase [Streptomyces sp. E11-3]|uniref:cellulase family glycosylhydrolase n=1 Tax=Streptomyces sp. E11-3 TaxID=3110112 RepID=UPI00397FDD33
MVDWAIADGLSGILDVHHDYWQWTSKMSTDHDKVLARFNTTWTQIAPAFRNEPAQTTAEPHGWSR